MEDFSRIEMNHDWSICIDTKRIAIFRAQAFFFLEKERAREREREGTTWVESEL
jgi:hypothetical protein